MTSTILLPTLVAIVGLVVYFAANGKASTAGLYAWAVGLLVALELVGRHLVALP